MLKAVVLVSWSLGIKMFLTDAARIGTKSQIGSLK
jgi:hypothetical protein